ncbi:MAG: DNA-binding protein [Pseudomonadota bacterium]
MKLRKRPGSFRPFFLSGGAFNAALPGIVGAILNAISSALRHIDQVKLTRLPRMADFAKLIEAASPGLGWDKGQFYTVYDGNRADMAEAAFEANPVAVWIDQLMLDDTDAWEGNATKLLQDINAIASETDKASKFWPASASSMGTAVRRAAPALRDHGLDIDTRHSGSRLIRIVRRATSK